MASLNKVLLMGNLTRDPELRYTPSGTAVADFAIAINRKYTTASGDKKEDTCFVDVTLWGRRAEVVNQYLKKGSPLFVEGRLHLDRWESPEGQKRSKLKVVGQNFQFIGRAGAAKPEDEFEGTGEGEPEPDPAAGTEDLQIDEDNIPF